MIIARIRMKFHPRGLLPTNPNEIAVGDDHRQEPNHPKVRGRRRNAFSGKEDDVKGVTNAIFRTMVRLGNLGKPLLPARILVGRKAVGNRLEVLAESRQEAPESPRVQETHAPVLRRHHQQQFAWSRQC